MNTQPTILEALDRAATLVMCAREALDLRNAGQARRNVALAIGALEYAMEQLEGGRAE